MADAPKSQLIMLTILALIVGYAGYSGDGISALGVGGLKPRMALVDTLRDSVAAVQARIDSAKADLATESVEDVTQRVDKYRGSLAVLRSLVPEQREVANLLDDIQIKAKIRGLRVSSFTPHNPQMDPGPAPFDTYAYDFSVIGKYHQVGQFLTDVAGLRRIIVPTGVSINGATADQARALGDSTGVLEARFTVKTYVKSPSAEDSTHVP
jgi:Tfp pilus assembly protein PilO